MSSFLDGLDIFFDKSTNASGSGATCTSDIDYYKFYQYSLIPSVLTTLLMAATKKRREKLMNVLDGRPGLIFPMDSLTRSSRISFACAFGSTSLLVYEVLINHQFAVDYEGPIALKTLIAILSMLIYGTVYFPIFASLALGTAFSYCLGGLFVWMFLAVDLYTVLECDYNNTGRAIVIARSLPSLLCHFYLSISLPYRFVRACLTGHYITSKDDMVEDTLTVEEVRQSYQGKHVTNLLHKPKMEEPVEGCCKSILASILGLIHRFVYQNQSGFRYPSRLLSVMLTAWIVVYVITVEYLVWFTSILDIVLDSVGDLLDDVGWSKQADDDSEIRGYRDGLLVAYYVANLTKICLLTATTVAALISSLTILHMLTSFRNNLYAMYRGDYRLIPSPYEKSAASLCVGSMKFAGFQVAYIVWSFIIVVLVLFIICFVLAVIITLLLEGVSGWLVNEVLQIWPGIVVTLFLIVIQMILAKKVFLQANGDYLRLNNRRFFFLFTYFMFFYNIFLGLVSCLLRIIKAMGVGIIFLARLDNSTLPRKFEFFDPGFNAYQGFIHMEAAHTHPVVIVFIRLLSAMRLENKKSAEKKGDNVHIEMDDAGKQSEEDGHPNGVKCSDISLEEVSKQDSKSAEKRKVNFSARFNWWVTYTLLQNPQVRIYRKGFIQAMSKARKEGIRIPISDKPISDFDLVKAQMEKEAERQAEEEARKALKEQQHRQSQGTVTALVMQKLNGDKDYPKDGKVKKRLRFFRKNKSNARKGSSTSSKEGEGGLENIGLEENETSSESSNPKNVENATIEDDESHGSGSNQNSVQC